MYGTKNSFFVQQSIELSHSSPNHSPTLYPTNRFIELTKSEFMFVNIEKNHRKFCYIKYYA